MNSRYWIYKPKNSEEVAVEVCGGASVSHTASSREALETQTNSSSLNATQCLFSFLSPDLFYAETKLQIEEQVETEADKVGL